MLTINNISFYLGNKQLYDKCSLFIKPKDKIGLIGANGAGKSTLLKLITGELKPDEGDIKLQNGFTLGFLNQDHLSFKTQDSIKKVAMQAFSKVLDLEKQLEEITKQMEENYSDTLCERMMKIQEEIEHLGGYEMESKTEEILEGMGFSTSDLERPLEEFSGGWRMRVMLAKMLLQQPSLMMLDEPTNHLDIESIKWLEKYLIDYENAFIVISHDRYFLNNITNRIVELENKKLISYSGNYDFYEKEKAKNKEIQQNAYERQQKEIEHIKTNIERFGAKASKASQAKSWEKRLERMEIVEAVDNKVAKVKFNFDISQSSGKIVATITDVEKKYDNLEIFRKSSAIVERQDKIAFIGANGKGKSTLLRMIDGIEPFQSGKIELGTNVTVAFYAQHQLESLNLENNIYEELINVNPAKPEQEIRKICGMFLFTKDDVYKKIRVLSGGEKARVALIKVLLQGANFLLLDEPTNHLDMISIEILAQAIQQYQGTCIAVSHDRHFVNKIATKIWYIKDMVLKEYPGNYEEFVDFEKNKKN